MISDPRDDFGVFTGNEHMFYGLADPFALVRAEVERSLRAQMADTVVDSITAHGEPKFLTLGRKVGDGSKMVVTWFGTCFAARIAVSYDTGRKHERLAATFTLLIGRIDEPGKERARTFLDVHADAERGFTDETFQARLMAFRHEA
jgi:hypothetical protein